ncbi:barstar family protein [Streptomyces sp. NBC_01207]|uniref:barstar family protein n=1 Tax=Streptomyces sp. NBC_01207 TaxID=2903772 RepID=UPI002E162173|nr:barstar family protein [Streptomyces sp. NBC_01207]
MRFEEVNLWHRLIEDDSHDLLVEAEGLLGFYGGSEAPQPEVTFLRVHQLNKGKRKSQDAILEVMNCRREKIGEYWIGQVRQIDLPAQQTGGGAQGVSYRFADVLSEYPEAGKVWRHWASNAVPEPGEWARWAPYYHETWLHVVQNSWFTSRRRASRYGIDENVSIDGLNITTKPSFYCALGEAVNGPRGYFGSNLDALADCLSPKQRETTPPFTITWHNFEESHENLGDDFIKSLLSVTERFHVRIDPR